MSNLNVPASAKGLSAIDSLWRRIFPKLAARAIPPDNISMEPIMNKIVNRRDILSATATAGIVGMSCSAAQAATANPSAVPALDTVSPELLSLISEFEKLNQEKEELGAQMDLACMRDDCPKRTSVTLEEVCGRALDYPPEHLKEEFFTTSALDQYFNKTRRSYLAITEQLEARRQADWKKARSILEDREIRYAAWEQASGHKGMEESYEAAYLRICKLEDAICDFECRSIGDLVAKVRFTQKWMSGDDLEWSYQHAAVLASMFDMALRYSTDGTERAVDRSS